MAGSVTQMWRGRCEGPMLVQRQAATGPSWPPFSLGTTAAAVQATFGIWTKLISETRKLPTKREEPEFRFPLLSEQLSFPQNCLQKHKNSRFSILSVLNPMVDLLELEPSKWREKFEVGS